MPIKTVNKMEQIDINKLIPYINNSRTHDASQIKKIQASMREFGFINPVIIDRDFNIIAGHGRVLAAQAENMETVPCVFAEDLTEAQRKAYIIADNQLAELSGWDNNMLKIELESLKEMDFDLSLTGFDLDDIDIMLTDDSEAVEDDYDIDKDVENRTKLGDIWQLGRHRLICGDSTDKAVIEQLMDDKKADLYLTDPPYNVDYVGKTKDSLKIKNDNMEDGTFRKFLVNAFSAADSVMKSGAVFYICHADSEGYNFRGACRDVGWQVRECLIWNKNSMVLGRQDYQWKHEPILYGWKEGTHLWASDRKQTTVLDFDRPTRSKEHPTMKPIPLFDYLIKNNTKSEDIVLDSFAGSATTLIACEQNDRTAYVCELDPHYCDVIINRWETLTGETAHKIN